MFSDLLAVLCGFCLFSLVAFFPGYAVGWLTNALRFRARTRAFRLAASAPLAISIGPIVSFTIGRWFSLNAVLALAVCLAVLGLLLIARDLLRAPRRFPKELLPFFFLTSAWLAVAIFSLIDLQFAGRTYFSIIFFDYSIRIPITQAISTFGLPARSPFFFTGNPVALRYHYFWMILCALVRKLGGGAVDARQTFIAGTLWGGIAILCIIPLCLRLFSPGGSANLYRRTFIGLCLVGVTGLDILPTLLMLFLNYTGVVRGISPSVEWWNNQVDGWLYTMLWEPHYICALVACLTGFLILWDTEQETRMAARLSNSILAGLAFATAVGAGIYIPLVFSALLSTWILVLSLKRRFRSVANYVISGITAAACAGPFLQTLTSGKSAGGSFLKITIRSFEPAEMFLKIFHLDNPWQLTLGNALLLPLNYLLELGVFFLVGYLTCKRLWVRRNALCDADLAGLLMAGISMAICTFVRSGVIANNDLGWRGFLICQFILLLWAADLFPDLASIHARTRSLISLFLVLGAVGVLYDLAILRFYAVLSDAGTVPLISWLSGDQHLGERTTANREAYHWLRAHSDPAAVVQQNPEVFQDTPFGMYGERQTVAGGKGCLTTFGGNPDDCAPALRQLDPVFTSGTLEAFAAACRALPVDFFVAKDTDPAWHDKTSWVWTEAPLFQNSFVRIYACPRKHLAKLF